MNGQNIPPVPEEVDKDWELMKKAGKIISRLFFVFCAICVLYMIPPAREAYWKTRTVAYVRLHEDALNEYVESFPIDLKHHEKYHGWRVSYLEISTKDPPRSPSEEIPEPDSYIIQFCRFYSGLVTGGTSAGMYYSPIDISEKYAAHFGLASKQVEIEEICDHWYWYIKWD